MSATEIILLIAGGIIFILSFIVPLKSEETSEEDRELAKDEIKNLVSKELEDIKSHVDEVVEETIEYAMEKTERSLERLSNEKIMAVNEYSDTVLQEINKNHQEVMFLYDMLNDKHDNIKNTVSEVNKTVKEVAETTKEAEAVVNSFQRLAPEVEIAVPPTNKETVEESIEDDISNFQRLMPEVVEVPDMLHSMGTDADDMKALQELVGIAPEISFMDDANEEGANNNEKIVELHKQGKSNVVIAKELGLGVGEVKLVIDLYKNL